MTRLSEEQIRLVNRVHKAVKDAIGRRAPEAAGRATIDVLFHESGRAGDLGVFEPFKASPLWLHEQQGDVDFAGTVGAVVAKKFQKQPVREEYDDYITERMLDILEELPPFDSKATRDWVGEIDRGRLVELQQLSTKVPRRPRDIRRLIATTEEAFRQALKTRLTERENAGR